MLAPVTDLNQWKAAHPPTLVFWQHSLQAWIAWQKLLIKVIYGPY
jgi:hypothetical protein